MQASSATDWKQLVTASGIVDANGNCEIDFPKPPAGFYYTGSITIYDSPFILWMLKLNGVTFDTIEGTATGGGIQQGPTDQLLALATGLSPYAGQTIHATFAVIVSPENNTDLVVPAHDTTLSTIAGTVFVYQSGLKFTNAGATFSTGILNVENFPEVLIQIFFAPGLGKKSQVAINWFQDGAGQVQLFPQTLINKSGVNIDTRFVLACVGPFMQLTWQNQDVAAMQTGVNIVGLGSNIVIKPSQIVPGPVIDVQNLAINSATQSADEIPAISMPGRARLWGISTGAINTAIWQVFVWTGAAWDILFDSRPLTQPPAISGATGIQSQIALPLSDWKSIMFNFDGAARNFWEVIQMEEDGI